MNQSNGFEGAALNVDTNKTQNLELLLDATDFPKFLTTEDFKHYELGAASKPNRRLTGGSVRFRAVAIVRNNRNRPEPDGTAGYRRFRRLGFEAVPYTKPWDPNMIGSGLVMAKVSSKYLLKIPGDTTI